MTLNERVTNVAFLNRATCGRPLPTCWADAAALGWPCWMACCMLQEAMTAPAASTRWSDSTPRPTPGKGWLPWTYAGRCGLKVNSLKPWKYFWGLQRWAICIKVSILNAVKGVLLSNVLPTVIILLLFFRKSLKDLGSLDVFSTEISCGLNMQSVDTRIVFRRHTHTHTNTGCVWVSALWEQGNLTTVDCAAPRITRALIGCVSCLLLWSSCRLSI